MKVSTWLVLVLMTMALVVGGCAEAGEGGEDPLDCGPHGDDHDGHCHCDDGFLFDGDSCVAAEEITEICSEEEEEEHAEEEAEEEGHDEEHDEACLCPATGICPCEHGTVETVGVQDYCVPEIHEE